HISQLFPYTTLFRSYLGTSWGRMKSSVKDSVPVEFEIERARKMVKDLLPDIRHNMHVIAKEEVEVARLERQIADAEEKLAVSKRSEEHTSELQSREN